MNLQTKSIEALLPLGTKDYRGSQKQIDANDRDNKIELRHWPVKSYYLPEVIAVLEYKGRSVFLTENEGGSRDYGGFSEEERGKDIVLDPGAFPDAAALQAGDQLGRWKITSSAGNRDGDGDCDELFGFVARSY